MPSLIEMLQAQAQAQGFDTSHPEVKVELRLEAALLAASGKTLEEVQREAAAMGPAVKEVPESNELIRIIRLPRRDSEPDPRVAAQLTEALRMPWGTQTLRPIQGMALAEIAQCRGGFIVVRVGGGKTLISFLAPALLDSKRPLILIPAKLRDKTRREFRKLADHWYAPGHHAYRIESFELLGRPQAAEMLARYKPDLIIMDEAHKVGNLRAAVTRRLKRYLAETPTPIVAMTGTISKRSLRDYAHIAEWALPLGCPVPTKFSDLEHWSDALDEKTNSMRRIRPGALVQFCNQEERSAVAYGGSAELSAVRNGFRRRLVETPGVVATQEGALGIPLYLHVIEPPAHDPNLTAAFEKLRTTWETPDEHPIADGITMWRHARELGLGFYYRWNPRPPDDWLMARKAWAKMCREILKHNRRGLDSESQVVNAVASGWYPAGTPLLDSWRKIKDSFIPQTEAVWLSTEALETAAKWVKDSPGIVWAEQTAFALELSRLTGLAYYGKNGRDAKTKKAIEDHAPGVALIASVASNSEGRNLQAWHSSLLANVPPNGKIMEQLLGRTHRDGQEADVDAVFYVACIEHADAIYQSQADAKYMEDTWGQAQKVLYADQDFPERSDWGYRGGARWTKSSLQG